MTRLSRSLFTRIGLGVAPWAASSLAISATALVMVVNIGCGGGSDPVSSASSQYKVAEGDSTKSPSATENSSLPSAAGVSSSGGRTNNSGDGARSRSALSGGVGMTGNTGNERSETPNGSENAPNNGAGQIVDSGSPPKPPAVPQVELDVIRVPEGGSVDELVAFLRKMQERPPQGATREEQAESVVQISRAIITAAERLLTATDDVKYRQFAVQHKLASLYSLKQLKQPGAEAEIKSFIDALVKDRQKPVADFGRLVAFNSALGEWEEKEKDQPEKLVQQLEQYLSQTSLTSESFINVVSRVPAALKHHKHAMHADQTEKIIVQAAEKTQNADLIAQVEFWQSGLDDNIRAVLQGDAAKLPELSATIRKLMETPTASFVPVGQLLKLAEALEMFHHYQAAHEIYSLIHKNYANHPNAEAAKQIAAMTKVGRQRTNLIGNQMTIKGTTLSGAPFDLSKYKGKFVLVDFWATWCGPCREEMPNILANYKKYHKQGLEVVGVNVDEDRGKAIEYIRENAIPWTTVFVDFTPMRPGQPHPNLAANSIESLPFIALLDPNGKVLDYHLRGEELSQRLQKLFPAAPNANGQLNPGLKIRPRWDDGDPQKQYFVSLVTTIQEEEEDQKDEAPAEENVNPYTAPAGLTAAQLAEFILNMQEKPRSIQERPGFGDAIVDAAERLLKEKDAPKHYRRIAIISKLDALHNQAWGGNKKADQALAKFVEEAQSEKDKKIARRVAFYQLERSVLNAETMPLKEVPQFLEQLHAKLDKEHLTARHLRLASTTIKVINRFESGDRREKYFAIFGRVFTKSESNELKAYGKKLIKKPSVDKLVGKPLDLKGATAQGKEFDWKSYRGKVVLIDFWAMWCAPCVRAIPDVKKLYDELKDKKFEVVGVNLDPRTEDLVKFLEEKDISWTNLAGEGTQDLANKCGVGAIPTLVLVDQKGKVVAVGHEVAALSQKAKELLKVKG